MKHFLWILFFVLPFKSWSQDRYVANSTTFDYKTLTNPDTVNSPLSYSENLSIGFDFKFYGQEFSQVNSWQHGYITFNGFQPDCCFGGRAIPNPDVPNGLIAGNWSYMNPNNGGSITYQLLGTSPSRIFVVSYDDIPQWNNVSNASFQIQLYETSNIIEVHCKSCENTIINQTQGIESPSGTEGIAFPGRNRASYDAIDDGVLFAPFYDQPAQDEILLLWQDIGSPTGYTLSRSLDGNTYVEIATLPAETSSYNDTGLEPDTQYYYQLEVSTGGGTKTIELESGTLPNAATDLQLQVLSAVGIELNWTDNSVTEDGYIVERSLSPGDDYEAIATLDPGTESYIDESLMAGTTYYYRVRAFNEQGVAPASNEEPGSTLSRPLYYVDSDAAGANDGSSWSNAFVDLSDAVNAAEAGSEIWVAEGTYYPGGDNPLETSTFEIAQPGINIYGGFNGTENSRDDRQTGAHTTVLSGDIGTVDDVSDNVDQLLYYSALANTLVLEDLVIRHAHSLTANGGAVRSDGDVSVENVKFENNVAFNGAALYSLGNTMVINCEFRDNASVREGDDFGARGGAVHFTSRVGGKELKIINSHLIDNTAGVLGGAIYATNGSSTFPPNTISIENTIVSGNLAGYAGGIYLGSNVDAFISGTTIDSNVAEGDEFDEEGGGGLYCSNSGHVQVERTTISGNRTAGWGGGMFIDFFSNVTLNHVTINNNEANNKGGGIFYDYVSSRDDEVKIQNTIIAGNNDNDSGYEDIHGELISEGHNLIGNIGMQYFRSTAGDIYGDTEEINGVDDVATRFTERVDPGLEALAENGGFTRTHALREDSRARDAGVSSDLSLDQRGFPYRGTPDIGAFEFYNRPSEQEGIPDQQAFQLQEFSYTLPENAFWAGDRGGLTYAATLSDGSDLPVWLSFDPSARRFNGTPGLADGSVVIKVTVTDQDSFSAFSEFNLTIGVITATDPLEYPSLDIYPNPVADVLHVHLPKDIAGKISLEVFTLDGLLSFEKTFTAHPGRLSLNTSSWNTGVYILKFHTATHSYQRKVLKE